MLRILIVFLCFLGTVSHAEEADYKEPDNEALKRAKASISEVFKKADELVKDETFLKDLQTQRQSVNQIPNNQKPNLYNFEDINPEVKEDHLIAKALAAGEKMRGHEPEPWTNSPLILVSFSMKETSIKRLMSEAAKIGANVVLRGAYNDDLPATVERIQKLASENGAGGVQIDPTLFSRFDVTTVPTFILPLEPIKTCNENGCEVPKHVKAHGTATLRYFLEKASRLGNEEEKAAAEAWLSNYKGDNNDNS